MVGGALMLPLTFFCVPSLGLTTATSSPHSIQRGRCAGQTLQATVHLGLMEHHLLLQSLKICCLIVTSTLGLDPVEFRRQNFYKIGDKTHFGQVMTEDDVTFDICFEECIRRIDYYKEKDLIQEYNQNNKDK